MVSMDGSKREKAETTTLPTKSKRSQVLPDDRVKKRAITKRYKMIPNKNGTNLKKVFEDKAKTITLVGGLYSTLLAAAKDRGRDHDYAAIAKEARYLQSAIKDTVESMSLVRIISTQMMNIALAIVSVQYFKDETRVWFATYLFQTKRTEVNDLSTRTIAHGQKIWFWTLHMAMDYIRSAERCYAPVDFYDSLPILTKSAAIDDPYQLIAFPGDQNIQSLVALMTDNPQVRNILLLARRIWWQGYATDMHERWPKLPKYEYRGELGISSCPATGH